MISPSPQKSWPLCIPTLIILHLLTLKPTRTPSETIYNSNPHRLQQCILGLLPLFKFWSMNGGIILKNGGPICWLGEHKECMSLSFCQTEIWATNGTSKKVLDFRILFCSVFKSGHSIEGFSSPTLLYNDNNACVKWLHIVFSKVACHIELRKNSIQEWVHDKTLNIIHVAGKFNPDNIFTKEMKDGAHFYCLRDSFMLCLSDFVNDSLLDLHQARQQFHQVTPAAALVGIASGCISYMAALASNSFCRTLTNVSNLCRAGLHLIWKHHHLIPSNLL